MSSESFILMQAPLYFLKVLPVILIFLWTAYSYLEIPENDEPCFTADTRQGVAIGYIAKPTEKSA